MLRESEGVLQYTSSETIILAQSSLTMALFSLIRRGELILGISGGREVISNWLLFLLHYPVMDLPYFLSWMLPTGLTVKVALCGGEKKGRRCPAGEKNVYEIGLHLQPALLPREVFVEL